MYVSWALGLYHFTNNPVKPTKTMAVFAHVIQRTGKQQLQTGSKRSLDSYVLNSFKNAGDGSTSFLYIYMHLSQS